jgi:pilus assembly protein Flp/PilA
MNKFLKMLRDSKGATAIEYGLIAALIAVAAITAVRGVGSQVGTTFTNVSGGMAG